VEDETPPPDNPEQPAPPEELHAPHWPRRQIYFVTVEWLDEPLPADTPPSRFTVRVKADDVAVELEGKIEHHHH
jgi:hypothetical protein